MEHVAIGANVPGCFVLQELTKTKKVKTQRAMNAARKIRDETYTCRQFFEDVSAAFPELALYLVSKDGEDTTSGRTADDEYQRTIGALFSVYWLMRLSIDGAQSFCFGVDSDEYWNPLSDVSKVVVRNPEEIKKRQLFKTSLQWKDCEDLFVDA